MEPMLPSGLMNEPIFDYWNPGLCSPPLISSTDGHTLDGQYLGNDSPFTDAWSKDENLNSLKLGSNHPHQISSPAWSEAGQEEDQSLNLPSASISSDGTHLPPHLVISPVNNDMNYLNSLDKDSSDSFLAGDILSTSGLYSPLNNDVEFKVVESADSMLGNGINTDSKVGASHSSAIEEEENQEMWRAVGVMEMRNEVKPVSLQNVALPTQGNIMVQNNHQFGAPDANTHSFSAKIHPQCLPGPRGHHLGSPRPLSWLNCSTQYPVKNHVRFRKGRCRKPLLRNFQSNFFRLPIQSKNKSPQLQMVKLFRSSVNNGKGPTVEEEEDLVTESAVLKPTGDLPLEDNPELALMKTVDMPSGKRVEDIYVVPSVWITSKNGKGGMKVTSETDLSHSSVSHNRSPNTLGRVLGNNPVMKQEMNYQGGDSRFSTFATPPTITPSSHSIANGASSSTEAVRLEDGVKCSTVKNLIITTLNAPKLDIIPCLKDLCNRVLRNEPMLCLHGQNHIFSPKNAPQPPINVAREQSLESKIKYNDKSRLDVFPTIETYDQGFHEMKHSPHVLEKFENDMISFPDMDKENSEPEQTVNLINSLSFHDTPELDHSSILQDHGDKDQIYFDNVKEETVDCPLEALAYGDDQNAMPNALEGDTLANLDAIINTTSNNAVSAFSTTPPQMTTLNSNESFHSSFDNANETLSEHTNTVSSLAGASSSSSFIDSPLPGDLDEEYTFNPPELVSLMRQINELQINDPINKPLANLSTTLHLLHDAEKTLCNTNFGVYQQLKLGQHPKFGQLIRCILSLTSTVVTMGKSLHEWTRSSTDNQCLKTVEIMASLYQNNIINLIELITPYFHFLCSLIASCHSDILKLNKTKMSTDLNPVHVENSLPEYHPVPPQATNDTPVLTDKTNSPYAPYKYSGGSVIPTNDLQNFNGNVSPQNMFQNDVQCARPPSNEYLQKMPNQFTHLGQKDDRSPNFRNQQKKQKVSLLKHGLPAMGKHSPYRKFSETGSPLTDVKYPAGTAKSDPSLAKTVLINVNSNKMLNSAAQRLPGASRSSHLQPPATSPQGNLLYQTVSSMDNAHQSQMPFNMVPYRAPFQNANLGNPHQGYNLGGPKTL